MPKWKWLRLFGIESRAEQPPRLPTAEEIERNERILEEFSRQVRATKPRAQDGLPRSNAHIADLNGTRFEGWFRLNDRWHDADGNVLYTLDRTRGWYDNDGRLAYDLLGDAIE
ncbi:hypothetical protein [Nocardia harenae]|uniref:hypothetical protein n=1 Tax=Nocardia harenae TaxID=358707 RepID=UPI0012EEB3D1|nr:hypothetical protein [Nocardia harenae]